MPLMAAAGTRVERIRPDKVKNSTAPERSWFRVSVSEPSWLMGNTCSVNAPSVSSAIFLAISFAGRFMGCDGGRMLAYLWRYVLAANADGTGTPSMPAPAIPLAESENERLESV